MTTTYWRFAPRDPIICRDGRPFGSGLRMRSLDWPYPSVVAGCVRSQVGYADGGFNGRSDSYLGSLEAIQVAGAFGYFEGDAPELLFPAPRDLIFSKNESHYSAYVLRPEFDAQFCAQTNSNLPPGIDRVCLIPENAGDFKPISAPFFWSHSRLIEWLANEQGQLKPFGSGNFSNWPSGMFSKAAIDNRTHVAMDPLSGASGDGMLFQSSGIDLSDLRALDSQKSAPEEPTKDKRKWGESLSKLRLSVRLRGEAEQLESTHSIDEWVTLAGERRLVHARSDEPPRGWKCDNNLAEKLAKAKRVRMILASPAVFEQGWVPDWLHLNANNQWEGTPFPDSSLALGKLRLISAIIERWLPVSGFSYRHPFGPKPIRRMVAAGSVYFFEVVDGEFGSERVSECWMESICSIPAERNAGFGLAVWGLW